MNPTSLTVAAFRTTLIFIFCFSNISGLHDETCSLETSSRCHPSSELFWRTTGNEKGTNPEKQFPNGVRIPEKYGLNPSLLRMSFERSSTKRDSTIRELERVRQVSSKLYNMERNLRQNPGERSKVRNIRTRESQEVPSVSEQEGVSRTRRTSDSLNRLDDNLIRNSRTSRTLMERQTSRDKIRNEAPKLTERITEDERVRRIADSRRSSGQNIRESHRRVQRNSVDSRMAKKESLLRTEPRASSLTRDVRQDSRRIATREQTLPSEAKKTSRTLMERRISSELIRNKPPQLTERITEDEKVRKIADSRRSSGQNIRESHTRVQRNSMDNRMAQKESLSRTEPRASSLTRDVPQNFRRIATREQTLPSEAKKASSTLIERRISSELIRNKPPQLTERITEDERVRKIADSRRSSGQNIRESHRRVQRNSVDSRMAQKESLLRTEPRTSSLNKDVRQDSRRIATREQTLSSEAKKTSRTLMERRISSELIRNKPPQLTERITEDERVRKIADSRRSSSQNIRESPTRVQRNSVDSRMAQKESLLRTEPRTSSLNKDVRQDSRRIATREQTLPSEAKKTSRTLMERQISSELIRNKPPQHTERITEDERVKKIADSRRSSGQNIRESHRRVQRNSLDSRMAKKESLLRTEPRTSSLTRDVRQDSRRIATREQTLPSEAKKTSRTLMERRISSELIRNKPPQHTERITEDERVKKIADSRRSSGQNIRESHRRVQRNSLDSRMAKKESLLRTEPRTSSLTRDVRQDSRRIATREQTLPSEAKKTSRTLMERRISSELIRNKPPQLTERITEDERVRKIADSRRSSGQNIRESHRRVQRNSVDSRMAQKESLLRTEPRTSSLNKDVRQDSRRIATREQTLSSEAKKTSRTLMERRISSELIRNKPPQLTERITEDERVRKIADSRRSSSQNIRESPTRVQRNSVDSRMAQKESLLRTEPRTSSLNKDVRQDSRRIATREQTLPSEAKKTSRTLMERQISSELIRNKPPQHTERITEDERVKKIADSRRSSGQNIRESHRRVQRNSLDSRMAKKESLLRTEPRTSSLTRDVRQDSRRIATREQTLPSEAKKTSRTLMERRISSELIRNKPPQHTERITEDERVKKIADSRRSSGQNIRESHRRVQRNSLDSRMAKKESLLRTEPRTSSLTRDVHQDSRRIATREQTLPSEAKKTSRTLMERRISSELIRNKPPQHTERITEDERVRKIADSRRSSGQNIRESHRRVQRNSLDSRMAKKESLLRTEPRTSSLTRDVRQDSRRIATREQTLPSEAKKTSRTLMERRISSELIRNKPPQLTERITEDERVRKIADSRRSSGQNIRESHRRVQRNSLDSRMAKKESLLRTEPRTSSLTRDVRQDSRRTVTREQTLSSEAKKAKKTSRTLMERRISSELIRNKPPQLTERITEDERVRKIADSRRSSGQNIRESHRRVQRNSLDSRMAKKESLLRTEPRASSLTRDVRQDSRRIATREQTLSSEAKKATRTLMERRISSELIRNKPPQHTERITEDETVRKVADSRRSSSPNVRESHRRVQRNSVDNRMAKKVSLLRTEPRASSLTRDVRQDSRRIATREQTLPSEAKKTSRTLMERRISSELIRNKPPQHTERITEDERVRKIADSRRSSGQNIRESHRRVQRNSVDSRMAQKESLLRTEPRTSRIAKDVLQDSRRTVTREPLVAKKAGSILGRDQKVDSLRRVRVQTTRVPDNIIPSRTNKLQPRVSSTVVDNIRNPKERRIVSSDVNNLDFGNGRFVDENNNIIKHSINWTNVLASAMGGLLVLHTIIINNSKTGKGFTGFTFFRNVVKSKTD